MSLPISSLLIVDDDADARERLDDVARHVLPRARRSHAATLADARAQLARQTFSMVLLDVNLPDGRGLDLLPWLQEHAPDTDAVIISGLGDDATVLQAIRSGAVGYLLKNGSDLEMKLSLASLERGGAPIDPMIARRILKLAGAMAAPGAGPTRKMPGTASAGTPPKDDASNALLTRREQDVLQFVAQGLSNREIARALNLSVNTIECHTKNIYRKLAVHSRAGAIHSARSRGLLD